MPTFILPWLVTAWQPPVVSGRGLFLCLALLAGCGEESVPARRVGHRPVYASEQALYDVSIALDADGVGVLAWTEGELGDGDPAWMVLGSGQVHRAQMVQSEFGPAARLWSPLLPVDGGFVRLVGQAGRATPIHLLELDADANLLAFSAIPDRWAPANPSLEAVGFEGRSIVAGSNGIDVVIHEIDPPWRVLVQWSSDCVLDDGTEDDADDGGVDIDYEDTVRIARAPDDTVIVIGLKCDEADLLPRWSGLARLGPGQPAAEDPAGLPDGDYTEDDLLAAGATRTALGTMWLTQEGKLRFFTQALDEDTLHLLGGATFEVDAVQQARLFATKRVFVVTYRPVEGAEVSEATQAVTIDPESATVSEPYEWPLSDDDCPIGGYSPTDVGLEYACVGRCQGTGCAERWLYQGVVELAY